MASHPIQVTITNMVNLVHDQLDNINQMFWQGYTHQANLFADHGDIPVELHPGPAGKIVWRYSRAAALLGVVG